jgi:hypothetical protein
MGALILSVGSILGLLALKHYSAQAAAAGSTAGATTTPPGITGAPDPNSPQDTKAPAQAEPIGNTFLSVADPVYDAAGQTVALPYRPSDPAYGGGIPAVVGVGNNPNPAGSPGSGISAIEAINAPQANRGIAGGAAGAHIIVSSLPHAPLYNIQRLNNVRVANPKLGSSSTGLLLASTPALVYLNRAPAKPLNPNSVTIHRPTSVMGHAVQQPAQPISKPGLPANMRIVNGRLVRV